MKNMEGKMRKQTTFIFLLLAGTFLIFWSCSNKSTSNNLTEGDNNAQDYQIAKEDVDTTMIDMNFDDLESAGWLNWNSGMSLADSVSYDSTSGWHLRTAIFDNRNFQTAVVDSFRFTDLGGNFQRHRDSTTNIFERHLKRSQILSANPDTSGTHWVRSFTRNTHWEGLADSVTTLNGNFSRHWDGQTEHRVFARSLEGTLSDLKFYTSDFGLGHRPHPFSGTANAAVLVDVEAPNRQVHLEGVLTITFRMENGQFCYHARLVRGTNWWEWDHCFTE
jgi:hypothetical protein